MSYTIVKTKENVYSSPKNESACPHCGSKTNDSSYTYGNLALNRKIYPSCYHYNVIVMLAKRLVKEEQAREEKLSHWINRWHLDRKLVRRIVDA